MIAKNGDTFYINVCGELVENHDCESNKCSVSTLYLKILQFTFMILFIIHSGKGAGCQNSARGKYNIGYAMGNPQLEGEDIYLRYFNGDTCHEGSNFESRRSTTIQLICDRVEQGPQFKSESEFCEYIFEWRTPAACPLRTPVRLPAFVYFSHIYCYPPAILCCQDSECSVKDSFDNTFDLSQLTRTTGSNYQVTGGDHSYELNVCAPLVATGAHLQEGCAQSDVAVCQSNSDGTSFISGGESL